MLDTRTRKLVGQLAIPHGAEGLAVSPDGATLFVCAHHKGLLHVFETASRRPRHRWVSALLPTARTLISAAMTHR
jgi:sugar lactone lactonase YvrE